MTYDLGDVTVSTYWRHADRPWEWTARSNGRLAQFVAPGDADLATLRHLARKALGLPDGSQEAG